MSHVKGRTWRQRNRRRVDHNHSNHCFEKLIKWSISRGLKLKSLSPKYYHETGRGLKTTRTVLANTVIISLPVNLLITFDNVLCNKHIAHLVERNVLTPKEAFVYFIILEQKKGINSYFTHYINSLPKTFTTPTFLRANLVQKLPGFIQDIFREQRNEWQKMFKNLQLVSNNHGLSNINSFHNSQNVTKEDARWALAVLSTRSVYFDCRHLICYLELKEFNIDLNLVNFALAPLLDLLNHKDTANVEVNGDSRTYKIKTGENYNPGDQVFINYGPHDNRQLFSLYGFVLPNNLHTFLPIHKQFVVGKGCFFDFTKLHVNVDKMGITCDGFNYAFEVIAHQQADPSFHVSSTSKTCSEKCIVYHLKIEILTEMLRKHVLYLETAQEFESASTKVVKELLEFEMIFIKGSIRSTTRQCMLI